MFSFTKTQKVVTLDQIHIGGQPGTYPTVVFAGLFFKGQPDFTIAQQQIENMFSLSNQTAIPTIPDFFIKKETYVEDIINFIENTLPQKQPFSIDIIDPAIKLKTLEILQDHKLLNRTIYNSIHIGTTIEEQDKLKQYTPAAAIIVAFNPKDSSPDGKIEVLENGAHLTSQGLLKMAQLSGIQNILVDTAALAPGENSGASIAALPVIKEEYGLPVGCAIHNVVEKSLWLNNIAQARKIVDAASNINIPLFGGDYAIFGPIENASYVIPIIAWQDILISEYTEQYFGITPAQHHPRRKLFE